MTHRAFAATFRVLWLRALPMACVSCLGAREVEDMKPPADFVPPPIRPLLRNPPGAARLGFGQGFYSLEVGDGLTWHWMGGRGELRLRNHGDTRTLRISGWIPMEFMKQPPRIRIGVDDRTLDDFVAPKREFVWEYVLGPELMGLGPTVLLVLETSQTVRAPGDPRDLGISIEQVSWTATSR